MEPPPASGEKAMRTWTKREKVLAMACLFLLALVGYLGRDDVRQFKGLTVIYNRWTGSITHCTFDGCKQINR
jgi:hypothetical protein